MGACARSGWSLVGDHICKEIAEDVDLNDMRAKFKHHDKKQSGRVSVDLFQQVVGDLGFVLDTTQKEELTNQSEVEKGEGENEIVVDYDDFVNKIADISRKSPSKQFAAVSPSRSGGRGPGSPLKNKSKEPKKIRDPPHRHMDDVEKKVDTLKRQLSRDFIQTA